jgi:formamidopyrimidine-DNA glycosylase
MPELPEVESAVVRLRDATVGKSIAHVELFHPALRRRISPKQLRSMSGAQIARVERRGKHQLLVFADERTLHAHFRMAGDWIIERVTDALPRHARAAIDFTDGSRVVLEDPRMLSTLDLHPAGAALELGLGPEPSDPALSAESLHAVFAKKRGPIKPVLLDQSVIAGLGNIYAAESLWHSKISPTKSAASLSLAEVRSLLASIRKVIERATGARYTDSSVADLAVYDRVGLPCRRCGTPIERMAQAGRSTYYCPYCQRDESVNESVKVAVKAQLKRRQAAKTKSATKTTPATRKSKTGAKSPESRKSAKRAKTTDVNAVRGKSARAAKTKLSPTPRAKRPSGSQSRGR